MNNYLEGQCYCGSVKYRVSLPLKFIAHDHCSICRRISGAPFVTWSGVREEQFLLLCGQDMLTTYKSTPDAERQFCETCGSHLFFRSKRWPGEVHFTYSTLTSKNIEAPRAHVFINDKVTWLDFQDSLPKYGDV